VMVLHDLHLALAHADTLCILQGGQVLRSGCVEDIYQSGVLQQAFGVQVLRGKLQNEENTYLFRK